MSKAVLASIKPKYCNMIEEFLKRIEVRKTRPKLETPFKVYIYCTKDNEKLLQTLHNGDTLYNGTYNGKTQFIKTFKNDYPFWKCGKVIGEFVCDEIVPISVYYSDISFSEGKSTFLFTGLTDREIINYLGNGNDGYGWHISDLIIYDNPKELQEFKSLSGSMPLKKAPQSWCYVNV